MKDHTRRYAIVVKAATVITILLLIAIFTFTSGVVNEMYDELIPIIDTATSHILNDEWAQAIESVQTLIGRYSKYHIKLRLFLDHEDIDDLESSLYACLRLAQRENDQAISELEVARNIVSYMKGIETFTWYNLF